MTDWLTVNAALRPDYVRNKASLMAHMTDWLTVNAALRPDYVRNKESPMFLRKISLKFCVKYR